VPLSNLSIRRPWLAILALALLLGLAFQGARGLWEPDEGRYTNVALQMIHSGDYVSLRRNEEALHFTKPPVTYWAIAASVNTFGRTEWAVRLPLALAFALTVMLVYDMGRRLVPAKPWLPALVYATCPLAVGAASIVTTDTMLAFTEALAVACYVRARFAVDGSAPRRWQRGIALVARRDVDRLRAGLPDQGPTGAAALGRHRRLRGVAAARPAAVAPGRPARLRGGRLRLVLGGDPPPPGAARLLPRPRGVRAHRHRQAAALPRVVRALPRVHPHHLPGQPALAAGDLVRAPARRVRDGVAAR
jgi:hypothetical protein